MVSSLQSSIRSFLAQVAKCLSQLRIRDIASRWTPRLLNRIHFSSAPLRRQTSDTCPVCGGVVYNGHHCENGHIQVREFRSERVALLKRIYPRTAAGLGLWAWGSFSPGKPSVLVVGGSPALGPDTAPRLALLA